jgi:hypothetical protein
VVGSAVAGRLASSAPTRRRRGLLVATLRGKPVAQGPPALADTDYLTPGATAGNPYAELFLVPLPGFCRVATGSSSTALRARRARCVSSLFAREEGFPTVAGVRPARARARTGGGGAGRSLLHPLLPLSSHTHPRFSRPSPASSLRGPLRRRADGSPAERPFSTWTLVHAVSQGPSAGRGPPSVYGGLRPSGATHASAVHGSLGGDYRCDDRGRRHPGAGARVHPSFCGTSAPAATTASRTAA